MVISLSESRVNYDNLLRYTFRYMNKYTTNSKFSFFVLGKWPDKMKPDLACAINPNNFNYMFAKDTGLYDDVKKWWTPSSELLKMNLFVKDRWKPVNLIKLEKVLPPITGEPEILDFNPDDFISVHCPDLLSIIEPGNSDIEVATLQLIIESIVETIRVDLPISHNIQLAKFLKAYLPGILDTVEPSDDFLELIVSLRYRTENYRSSRTSKRDVLTAAMKKIRLNLHYFGENDILAIPIDNGSGKKKFKDLDLIYLHISGIGSDENKDTYKAITC